MTHGWLYVLANSYMGGLVKIGRTDRAPGDRVDELSADTGVPTPFILVWHEEVSDSEDAEREAHAILDQYRVSVGREFFRLDIKAAIEAVCLVASRFAVPEDYTEATDNPQAKWEREDELFAQAFQLVQKKKIAMEEWPRDPRNWLAGVDPRVLRIEFGMDWEESRRIFQKLQDIGAIDRSGYPT